MAEEKVGATVGIEDGIVVVGSILGNVEAAIKFGLGIADGIFKDIGDTEIGFLLGAIVDTYVWGVAEEEVGATVGIIVGSILGNVEAAVKFGLGIADGIFKDIGDTEIGFLLGAIVDTYVWGVAEEEVGATVGIEDGVIVVGSRLGNVEAVVEVGLALGIN